MLYYGTVANKVAILQIAMKINVFEDILFRSRHILKMIGIIFLEFCKQSDVSQYQTKIKGNTCTICLSTKLEVRISLNAKCSKELFTIS